LSQHKKNFAKMRRWMGDGRQTSMRKKTKTTYTLELLESRVLLSGDLAGAVQAAPVESLEGAEQAVVLSVPRADSIDQQTWAVSDMLAEPPSSFSAEGWDSQRDPAIASPALPDSNTNLSVPEIIGGSDPVNSPISEQQIQSAVAPTVLNQISQAPQDQTLTVHQILSQPMPVVTTASHPAIPIAPLGNQVLQPTSQDPAGQNLVVSQPVMATSSDPTGSIGAPLSTGTTASVINPELPRVYVDTSMPTASKTVTVGPSGADYTSLQQALNEVSLGTTILLQPGVSYTTTNGNGFVLPNKTTGTGWIVIRPALPDSALPAQGTRLTPADAALLPKIVRSGLNVYAMSAEPGAHHYRIIGLEFMNQGNVDTKIAGGAFVNLGSAQETTLAKQSHHILFDRVYIHGPAAPQSIGIKFGIVFGGHHQGIINSTIEEITYGSDAIAVGSWAGAGPFVIKNNALSSSGENIMFGGGDTVIANLVPSDIEIRDNHIFKPLKWRDDPRYNSGTRKILVKNLLETKNAQRILIDANVFENMWPGAQGGFAFTLTPRQATQYSTQPWTIVQDVTITNNIIANTANGIAISGQDPGGGLEPPTAPGGRILVKNNLFMNTGGYPGTGTVFLLANGAFDVTIQHNTMASRNPNTAGTTLKFTYGASNNDYMQMKRFTLQDNLFLAQNYPFWAGGGVSVQGLALAAPGFIWTNNVFAGPWPTPTGVKSSLLPQGNGNSYPANESSIGYVNLAGRDYRLASISPYKNAASDGKDIGVNWNIF
jgi:hypothetical protein